MPDGSRGRETRGNFILECCRFGSVLVEGLQKMQGDGFGPVDVDQLDTDLEFILIDKASPKSDILQRKTNLKKHGGVRMYAEV